MDRAPTPAPVAIPRVAPASPEASSSAILMPPAGPSGRYPIPAPSSQ